VDSLEYGESEMEIQATIPVRSLESYAAFEKTELQKRAETERLTA
jgi:hypothetical protein